MNCLLVKHGGLTTDLNELQFGGGWQQSPTFNINKKVAVICATAYNGGGNVARMYIKYDGVEHLLVAFAGNSPSSDSAPLTGTRLDPASAYSVRFISFYNNYELKDKVIESIRFAGGTSMCLYCMNVYTK